MNAKHAWGLSTLLVVMAGLIMLPACGSPETAANQDGALLEVLINPYREECRVNGELRLCYVTNVGDTGEFSPYEGQIENFEYEWGYGYEISGSGDENRFLVDEVLNKTAEPGGVHFPLVITGGGNRIVQTDEGLYEFYGEKSFSCADIDSCGTLDRVITREQPITFEFQTPEDPADPYILLDWESEAVPAQVGEEPGLLNGNWVLQSITLDKDVQEPSISGSHVTANFALDDSLSKGTVSGNGGCNDYTADFTISGNSINIENLERGEAQCTDPPGVMEQEQRFVSALTVAESFSVEGGRLQIVYNSGDSVLHLVRADE